MGIPVIIVFEHLSGHNEYRPLVWFFFIGYMCAIIYLPNPPAIGNQRFFFFFKIIDNIMMGSYAYSPYSLV